MSDLFLFLLKQKLAVNVENWNLYGQGAAAVLYLIENIARRKLQIVQLHLFFLTFFSKNVKEKKSCSWNDPCQWVVRTIFVKTQYTKFEKRQVKTGVLSGPPILRTFGGIPSSPEDLFVTRDLEVCRTCLTSVVILGILLAITDTLGKERMTGT